MFTDFNLRKTVRLIWQSCPTGPLLVLGCPPLLSRRLREQGYEAIGETLPHTGANVRGEIASTVIVGVFEPGLVRTEWKRLLAYARMHARQNVILILYTGDSASHLRGEIERHAFEFGLRKHPAYYHCLPYVELENERDFLIIPLQKLPSGAASAYPLESLMAARPLHMDMSRETGRRSDGHMMRYAIAARYVRPGDFVVDAACGMGYGAWMLAATTRAGAVTGLDIDSGAVEYASNTFASPACPLDYRVADVQDISAFSDNSVDLIASFETIEHIDDPQRFFAEAARILRPGGRIIVSVPNRWVDATGRDPNPHHQHVYDWTRLFDEMSALFIPERAIAQTAGGGFRLSDQPRSIIESRFTRDLTRDSEWCLAVGMKSPLGNEAVPFDDRNYPARDSPAWQLTRFAEQYANPWIVPALVQHGALRPWRLTDAEARCDLAVQVIEQALIGSADHGAALAVLGYELLENPASSASAAVSLTNQIDDYIPAVTPTEPVSARWIISLLYLKGLLIEAFLSPDAALAAFTECCKVPPLQFGPAIAVKTISAHYRIGRIQLMRGNSDAASAAWRDGVNVCRDVIQRSTWGSIVGDTGAPDAVGLFELSDVISIAQQCAAALEASQAGTRIPVNVWHFAALNKDRWLADRDAVISEAGAQLAERDWRLARIRYALR